MMVDDGDDDDLLVVVVVMMMMMLYHPASHYPTSRQYAVKHVKRPKSLL